MALVVFVVGTAAPTSPEQALARYAAECLDQRGHTTLIAEAATESVDATIHVAHTDGGFQLGTLLIADTDLEVHGCGATLAPAADEALRRELAIRVDDTLVSVDDTLVSVDDTLVSVDDTLVFADEALALHDAGAVLLDVRSNGPHDQVVPGAIQVEKDRVVALDLPRDLPIVVFCNGERGSTPVVHALRERGHRHVRHIRGGYAALARLAYAHLG